MLTAAARYVAHRKRRKALKRRGRSNSLPTNNVVSAETSDTPITNQTISLDSNSNVIPNSMHAPNVEHELIDSRRDELLLQTNVSSSSSYAATKALLESFSQQDRQSNRFEQFCCQSDSDDSVYADENDVEFRAFNNASQVVHVTAMLKLHEPLQVEHKRILDALGVSLWQCGVMIGVLLANIQDKAVQIRYVFVHPSLRGNRFAELMMHQLIHTHKFQWIRVIEPLNLDVMLPALRRACKRLSFVSSNPSSQWLRAPVQKV